jgi:protein-S-isoprenylcysteine O-methyltransferase Ste14
MTDQTAGRDASGTPIATRLVLKRVLQILAYTIGWSALLFASAGRIDWARGWIYLGVFLLGMVVTLILILRKNPALIGARSKMPAGAKKFDRVFMILYVPLLFVLPAVAGLDAVRFGWTSFGFETVWAGVVLHLLGTTPVVWAMVENPFLEVQVRIQTDRGHRVISTGPYRFVRHPMYVGVILQNVAIPLILGSRWSFAPAGAIIALFLWRTSREDRVLRRELAGYEDFARRTRYRLLPGVW